MSDNQLREALFSLQLKYGTPISFIATKCGVSREHLSRWLWNEDYRVSEELKDKINKMIRRGEM